jgi:hypothetical protein
MDKPLPPDFDPNSLGVPPAPRRLGPVRDQSQRGEEGSDEQSSDDGLLENHERIPVTDARFTSFLNWVFGIAATLVTLGIVWIANVSVSTASKVDVLIDRPEPVPRWQYESDVKQIKDDLKDTQSRVTAVETLQKEGINRGYEQRYDAARGRNEHERNIRRH